MDWEKMNFLPEWQDDRLNLVNEGDEWKWRPAIEAAKVLYNKWRELFNLIFAFMETLPDDEDGPNSHTKRMIYEDALPVAPKIMSAAGDTMYIIKMENAAIIRHKCRQLMEQVGFSVLTGAADEKHKEVIIECMEEFQELFKQWVATFEKDEYEDEWGLFV